MSTGAGVRAFIFSSIFILSSFTTKAATWQISSFLSSIKGSVYEFDFLVEGLKSVHSISFQKTTKAQYQSFFNRMVLGIDVNDGAARMLPFQDLDVGDIGSITHEAFHAYKANLIDLKPEFRAKRLWMKRRAELIFSDLAPNKRETALEEAYAVFIDSAITSRIGIGKMLQKPNHRCTQQAESAEKLWNVHWNSDVVGYYYRDGFGEYWADTFGSLWTKLFDRGSDSQNRNRDKTVYTETSISEFDKEWIAKNLLQDRIYPSFSKTFEGSPVVLACVK